MMSQSNDKTNCNGYRKDGRKNKMIVDDDNVPMDIDSEYIQLSEQNNNEILRIIQQYLCSHGFKDIAQALEQKSNVSMEDQNVIDFRNKVMNGEYFNVKEPLKKLKIGQDQQKIIEYQIFEQHYLELMEKGQKIEAIQILQKELVPRSQNTERLHFLAQLIMCGNDISSQGAQESELRQTAAWKGSDKEGRQDLIDKLQQIMPACQMLEPNRLEKLMKQSISFQVHNCKFHNIYQNNYSLLEDHSCTKFLLPNKQIAVLQKHKDEVWLVKFSMTGKKLATVAKDNIILIWSFNFVYDNLLNKSNDNNKFQQQSINQIGQNGKYKIKLTNEIKGHLKNILFLNWTNQDDRWIITGGQEPQAKIWDSKIGKLIGELEKHGDNVQNAIFSQDDTHIISVGID